MRHSTIMRWAFAGDPPCCSRPSQTTLRCGRARGRVIRQAVFFERRPPFMSLSMGAIGRSANRQADIPAEGVTRSGF